MDIRNKLTVLAAVTCLTAGIAACDRNKSNEGTESQVDHAADVVSDKYDSAKDTVTTEANKAEAKIDDATITTKVKAAILAEPGLKVLKIDVDTAHGAVSLTGTVDTQANKDRAEEITKQVEGVTAVNNSLTVKAA